MKKLIEAHKFFVKHSRGYVRESDDVLWKTKDYTYFNEGSWIPQRGSITSWYYPLSVRNALYYPIAYIKFMSYAIRDLLATPPTSEAGARLQAIEDKQIEK